ncbi:hypothetical protein BCR44DRAFT_32196 [Catenaria anguillulae PL171]|uniref:Uncharacterized protein n=1 Tax=Catenaria anguillulae PL171 TaxID=765915 RepID=A0A1Y2HID6_9FUNG|nr:hypothetical protein BCR44DRAFT_32196 [Catenaria anguillulae PL171]
MATSSSFSLKDVATTGVAVAASLAALYSVLSLSVRLDLAQDEHDRRRRRQAESQPPKSSLSPRHKHRRRKSAAAAVDQSVGPDRMGALPGDSVLLHSSTVTASDTHVPIPSVPPPSMVSALAPPSGSAFLDDSSIAMTSTADDPLLRLSQLDQPTLDSELARTDAKLRRLLKRKEKLELRRNQLSVHQMRIVSPVPPTSAVVDDPSIAPSVTLPHTGSRVASGSQIRPLTADERILFGLPPMGVGGGVPTPPSAEGEQSHASSNGRNRRDSVSVSTSTSTGSTDSASGDGAVTQLGRTQPQVHISLGVSSVSSEHNELDAAAATSSSSSTSSSSAAAEAELPIEEDDVVNEEEDDDDDSDVLSSISDTSAGMESVISDTSLGSDFSFLSDARYGLFHQHG